MQRGVVGHIESTVVIRSARIAAARAAPIELTDQVMAAAACFEKAGAAAASLNNTAGISDV